MDNTEKQFDKMTKSPIPKLIISLAIPTVINMLVTAIYNSADAYFVSKLGTSASGAVGIVFSLMSIIQALGFTISMGAGSRISMLLGAKKNEEAEITASSALFAGILFGLLLVLSLSFNVGYFMKILGSTDTILPYAISYGRYIIFGAPFMMGAFTLNTILRSQGKAKYAMFGITSGGIINVILDPLFIFTFKLGTAGAAIATLLSQSISFFILLTMFLTGKSVVRVRITKISKSISLYLKIIKTGLPSLGRQGFACIATMLLNINAAVYGDSAVAAMSIVGKVSMIIFAVMIGIGQGFQPVVGINYGAKEYKRVKKAIYFTTLLSFGVAIILGTPIIIYAKTIMSWFTKDDFKVIEYGIWALRAQCMAFYLMPISNVINMTLQITGRSWSATFLSCLRQGIFFIPLIIILPKIWGVCGIQYSQPISDFLTGIFSIPFGVKFLKDLKKPQ